MNKQKALFFAIIGVTIIIALFGLAAEAGYLSLISQAINEYKNELEESTNDSENQETMLNPIPDEVQIGINIEQQLEKNIEEQLEGTDIMMEEGVKTPFTIVDAVVADGGRYLILRLLAFRGLGIYDAQSDKLVKILELQSENFLYAAGGKKVLVYYPENNKFQTFSLETFEELRTENNLKGHVVTRVTMGHSNGDRAFIRFSHGNERSDNTELYILDVNTLQPIEMYSHVNSGFPDRYKHFFNQRANGDLTIVTEWATSPPRDTRIFQFLNNNWTKSKITDSNGYLAVGDDDLIYTESGKILNSRFEVLADFPEMHLIPGMGGALYLGIRADGEMGVYVSGSSTYLGAVGKFPGLDNDENYQIIMASWEEKPYVFDRHIFFNPRDGYILIIPPENDRIIKREFDLQQVLSDVSDDYLVVISTPDTNAIIGETWQYQIDALTGGNDINYTIEFGPDGMYINENGKMFWDVPLDPNKSTEKVIVLVENENDETAYHIFELQLVTTK